MPFLQVIALPWPLCKGRLLNRSLWEVLLSWRGLPTPPAWLVQYAVLRCVGATAVAFLLGCGRLTSGVVCSVTSTSTHFFLRNFFWVFS